MTATISLLPCEPSDALVLVQLEDAAFVTDPLIPIAFGFPSSQANIDFRVEHKIKNIQEAQDKAASKGKQAQDVVIKAVVDEEGKQRIVGYAIWEFQLKAIADDKEKEDDAKKVALKASIAPAEVDDGRQRVAKGWTEWPPGANVELCNKYFGALRQITKERIGGQRMAFLHMLVVHPDFQRQGIGRMLIQQGLDKADAAGLSCWLGATAQGLGLYKKSGFQEVKKHRIDLGPWGGDGYKEHTMMIRPVKTPL